MHGLNVISALRLGTVGSNRQLNKKVITVQQLPQIRSMDAKGIGEVLKNVEAKEKMEKKESKISKHGTNNEHLGGIEERADGDSSVDDDES